MELPRSHVAILYFNLRSHLILRRDEPLHGRVHLGDELRDYGRSRHYGNSHPGDLLRIDRVALAKDANLVLDGAKPEGGGEFEIQNGFLAGTHL